MPASSFNSRFEKEIELGEAVRQQVQSGIPKGNLRAISAIWLGKYFDYITALGQRETD